MATVVLGGAGSAIAGPVGGAIGAFAGRQVDRSLRGQSHRRRLSDLRVQTSQYGTEIPGIIGRMRVAGTIIWSTDLVPTTVVSKSGTGNSYSVSIAVAISSRPVLEVGRIWADGRLIRGMAGDHKIRFSFRLLDGSEDQQVDPLIASAEGMDSTPAYRGLSLAIFEDLDLSTVGNRIPQITLEIMADAGLHSPEEIIGSLLELPAQPISGSSNLSGYAVHGDTLEEAVAPLQSAFGTKMTIGPSGWEIRTSDSEVEVPQSEIGAASQLSAKASRSSILGSSDLPNKVSFRYFDPALDFAAGEKVAKLPGAERLLRVEFPGALSSDRAKSLAQQKLADAWTERSNMVVHLPLKRCRLRLGDAVALDGDINSHRVVTSKRIERNVVAVTLTKRCEVPQSVPSEFGAMVAEADVVASTLQVALVELPTTILGPGVNMGVLVAGGSNPWRPVPLRIAMAGAVEEVSSARQPATIGALIDELPGADPSLFDDRNTAVVCLDEGAWLTSVSDEALLGGANLAMIGSETLQFGFAEALGSGMFRLGHFLRGRFGTEQAESHPAGARFILLQPGSTCGLSLPAEVQGAEVCVEAFGIDRTTVSTTAVFRNLLDRPWRPVHPEVQWTASALKLAWIRRGRQSVGWLDHVDAPLSQSSEQYRVTIAGQGEQRVELQTAQSYLDIPLSELDGLGPRPWSASVVQVGDYALSQPLYFSIV